LEAVRLQLQVSNSAREPLYTYNVKVINPSRKRDTKTLTWHGTDVFTSPLQMKERLIESFHDYVPGITEIGKFNLEFFESRNSTGKRWIVSSEDIERMYRKFEPGSKIPLWCDGKPDAHVSCGKKRSTEDSQESGSDETPFSKREKKQSNIDNLSLELHDKHGDKFSGRQYKLWSRLIDSGQWNDTERPPNLPIFGATLPKKGIAEKESTSEVIASAAVAIIKHLQTPPLPNTNTDTGPNSIGISPGKKAKLRKEYLDQLKDIQKLRDDEL